MDSSLAVQGRFCRFRDIQRPFSNFDFVEDRFSGTLPEQVSIRRLFSQARSRGARTLVTEDILAVGAVLAENEELTTLFSDHRMGKLKRLTFWKPQFASSRSVAGRRSSDLIGVAILKQDIVPSLGMDRWHVFESVFVKYPHGHNCVPAARPFRVRCCDSAFRISGVVYCQQNLLNKACAQVAIRSLLMQRFPDKNITYREINDRARTLNPHFKPHKGLKARQIRSILKYWGILFTDIDYTTLSQKKQQELPYQKFLYAGIESGAGALLGFEFSGAGASGQRHIIPFFGHTFNEDTWVSNADAAYFHVGDETKYIPSENWVSSFIGHDDNFGSNFCVPRLYVSPEQVKYVVSLLPGGAKYDGVKAEGVALEYLYSLLPKLGSSSNRWLSRLTKYSVEQKIVLRAVCVTRRQYIRHLRAMRDWDDRSENPMFCSAFKQTIPPIVWMVEVSVPELFPANQRKVGEIVLDATRDLTSKLDFSVFSFARLPGRYLFFRELDGESRFWWFPSRLRSHTPLYRAH